MEIIKTQYMDKAQRGYGEYFAKDITALKTQSPVPGDRAFLADGTMYFCWDTNFWTEIGNPSHIEEATGGK